MSSSDLPTPASSTTRRSSSTAAAAHPPLRPRDAFVDVGRCGSTGKSVRLCYHSFGSPKHACILLVMGLASPSLFWDDRFCTTLALAGPFHVVRFDNRDVGLSTHLEETGDGKKDGTAKGSASYMRFAYAVLWPGKRTIPEVYTLMDMANDAFGLLDALHVSAAHLVGSSMGGTVIQCMAMAHPERVLSLALLSTHSSSPQTQWPSLRDMMGFISLVPKSMSAKYASRIAAAADADEKQRLCAERDAEKVSVYAASFTKVLERLAGDTKKYPFDKIRAEKQMTRIFRRSLYVDGGSRQFLALLNASSRDDALRQRITSVSPGDGTGVLAPSNTFTAGVSDSKRTKKATAGKTSASTTVTSASAPPLYVPTIILHGDRDPLVPLGNGKHLAAVIPGSRLYLIQGMGHTLIPALRDTYVRLIQENVRRGEAAAQSPARKAAQAAAASAEAKAKKVPAAKLPSKL